MDKASYNSNELMVLYDVNSNLNDVLLASALIKLSPLTESLLPFRARVGITEQLAPPAQQDLSSLVEFIRSNVDKSQETLAGQWSVRWIKQFRLSDNWFTPLIILLMTSCLPVPEDPPVLLIPPRSRSNILDLLNRIERGQKDAEFPYITFQYAISLKDLQQYLSEHAQEYRDMLRDLPPKKRTRITLKTLNIGHAVWLLREADDSLTWSQIRDELNPKLPSDVSIDEVDCMNSYKAYIKLVKTFND